MGWVSVFGRRRVYVCEGIFILFLGCETRSVRAWGVRGDWRCMCVVPAYPNFEERCLRGGARVGEGGGGASEFPMADSGIIDLCVSVCVFFFFWGGGVLSHLSRVFLAFRGHVSLIYCIV